MENKNGLNYIIDWILFISMLVIIITGIVLWGWIRPAGMSGHGSPQNSVKQNTTITDSQLADNHNSRDNRPIHEKTAQENSVLSSERSKAVTKSNIDTKSNLDTKSNIDTKSNLDTKSNIDTKSKPAGNSKTGTASKINNNAGQGNSADNQPKILWGLFRGQTFFGMTKNGGWKSIHCWVSVLVLVPFFIFHLLLHLRWIRKTTALFFKKEKGKTKNNPASKI